MMPVISCPDRDVLQRLMLGQVPEPEGEQLAQHLEQCSRCLAVVQALTAEDTLVEAARATATVTDSPEAPAIRGLIERIRQLGPITVVPVELETQSALSSVAPATDAVNPGLSAAVTAVQYDFLTPAQGPAEIGRLGPYRILKVLGFGGMGVVFEAEDPQLQRRVALKALKLGRAASPTVKERFLREARAAAAVKHDHVVTIYHVGEDRGVPFLAMELLQGEMLEERLKREGRLSVPEVLRLGRQIAQGLAVAHESGLIHRDIKPANVWLETILIEPENSSPPDRVKILDFGLARAVQDDLHLTQSGAILGTPAYMAPEQAQGEKIDPRCDLFSLGVMLYRMCTGEVPFRGQTHMALYVAVTTQEPASVQELNAEVPPALAELVMQLLAKEPAKRPASAREVAGRLQAIQKTTAERTRREQTAEPPAVAPEASVPEPARGASRRRRGLVAAVVALLVLIGGGFAAYQLLFKTKDGTLIVEVDGDADVRFQKGELRIFDSDGNLKYTLKPSEKNMTLPPGKYVIEVAGVDGLKLETDKFEITRDGKTTVRVTVDAAAVAVRPGPASDPYRRLAELALRSGRAVTLEDGSYLLSTDKLPSRAFKLVGVGVRVGPEAPMTELLARLKDLPDATLTHLNLVSAPGVVTDVAFEALVKTPSLREVGTLDLEFVPLTDAGLRHLRHLPKVNGLMLNHMAITGDGMKFLRDHMAVTNYLSILDPQPKFTEEALQYLDPRLTGFSLRGQQFGDVSLTHIGKATNLDRLDLLACPGVTDAGLKRLHGLGKLRSTRLLKLPKVTRQGVEALHKALPGCKIEWDGGTIEPKK
ncbi:MAG: protein kinase [Planctomycetes bacterium]|nr:protein kinase [Planctomycetota bacterium]